MLMPQHAFKKHSDPLHLPMANAIRFLAIDAVEEAQSGHPGMPMGLADVATVLYRHFLSFNPDEPYWPNRDRVILSNGHGSMLQYALLYLTGYPDMTIDELKAFRQLGSATPGHPEYGHTVGIETTTGPLGQGLGNGVGMALASKHLSARIGPQIFDHKIYVFAGDGCLMEGISHEACSFAGHLKLNNLIVLFDDNEISIDGPTRLTTSDNVLKRFESYNWNVLACDGHDSEQIYNALSQAQQSDKPTFIACKTKIGFGASSKEGKAESHGSPLGEKEVKAARENLGWPHKPFEIPKQILEEWRNLGQKNQKKFNDWLEATKHIKGESLKHFNALISLTWDDAVIKKIQELKKEFSKMSPNQSTRQSSGDVIDAVTDLVPFLIGGSADLTGSNNTFSKKQDLLTAEHYGGSYIHYGVREHAMAAIMNGLSLTPGIIPYGGTFLCFADYCKPAIRLSALMNRQVIYVMTHDSIGLGEDGPTHQPVEHLASLRAIPNIQVIRPADAVETAEAWEVALASADRPTILVLSRQSLPCLRQKHIKENLVANGAYVLEDVKKFDGFVITLVATGSEVSLAYKIRDAIGKHTAIRIVSMPSWELYEEMDDEYKESVFPLGSINFVIEAGSSMGWSKYAFNEDTIISLNEFGASGKANDLYDFFGFSVSAIVEHINETMEQISLGLSDALSD